MGAAPKYKLSVLLCLKVSLWKGLKSICRHIVRSDKSANYKTKHMVYILNIILTYADPGICIISNAFNRISITSSCKNQIVCKFCHEFSLGYCLNSIVKHSILI